MRLDEKGRCCGRKPVHYKGGSWCSPPKAPLKFCDRCCREFDPETGWQRENWAWRLIGGKWIQVGRASPTSEKLPGNFI